MHTRDNAAASLQLCQGAGDRGGAAVLSGAARDKGGERLEKRPRPVLVVSELQVGVTVPVHSSLGVLQWKQAPHIPELDTHKLHGINGFEVFAKLAAVQNF